MNFSHLRSRFLSNPINKIKTAFGIKEVFILGGLAVMSYGLWLHSPWVSFVVGGTLLMLLGLAMRNEE